MAPASRSSVAGVGPGPELRFDVSEVLPGVVEEATFKQALEGRDWSSFAGQSVRLTGCAPMWAFLFVAVRLCGHVTSLWLDDGSESGVRVK